MKPAAPVTRTLGLDCCIVLIIGRRGTQALYPTTHRCADKPGSKRSEERAERRPGSERGVAPCRAGIRDSAPVASGHAHKLPALRTRLVGCVRRAYAP